jgi:hypothetical protein
LAATKKQPWLSRKLLIYLLNFITSNQVGKQTRGFPKEPVSGAGGHGTARCSSLADYLASLSG